MASQNKAVKTRLLGAFLLLYACCFWSCTPKHDERPLSGHAAIGTVPLEPLVKVNYIDQNGISETIVHPERLKQFSLTPLLSPQSYKKLLRIYKKDALGNATSILTSYYDNGQLHQYLECINSRASGWYCEWHENGKKKLETHVIAGVGDLNPQAIETFSFQGEAKAWTDKETLFATCQYEGGKLHGTAYTYHTNGKVATKTVWKNGLRQGIALTYNTEGLLQESTSYDNGKREGKAEGFHNTPSTPIAFEEWYENDLLLSATYWSVTGEKISSVQDGWGIRSRFENGLLVMQHDIEKGLPEGKVVLFTPKGLQERTYFIRNGKKHGLETIYTLAQQKQRTTMWVDGEIHGLVQTWYLNGVMESSREFCHNQKQGVSTSWYRDGSIMLVEEYQADKLLRGRYHRKGCASPISTIEHGHGVASLFDGDGTIIETVSYRDSLPELKE